MGIRPNKSGDIIVNPPDTSQSRWGDWVTGLEGAGDTAGGVVSEIDAKAESANTGSGELATGLTALEGRVAAVSPSLMRFVSRPGTEFFDSDLTLPTEGQFHQSVGDRYNILFTVPVLATVVWDGNTPLSIQSWGTNGSSAVRQIGAIPAADAGVARSFVAILTPTGSRGSIFATGDGSGSHVVWISLQRLERFV